MPKCESAFTLINKLWEQYGDVLKAIGGAVAAAATGNPAAAVAAVKAADEVERVIDQMEDRYTEIVGKGTWKTIGPRALVAGTRYNGTLVSTSGRVFTSVVPCHEDRMRIQVWETGGKAKTAIDVCLVGPKGEHTEVATYTLNEDSSDKKNEREVVNKVITGALGHWVVVKLDAKSVANKFAYSIALTHA